MSLPTVEDARAVMLAAVAPLGSTSVPLGEADGRRLAEPVRALRHQPPFDASAMDGWAVRAADVARGARLRIVGESAAGHEADLAIAPGEAARIFTGAPLPAGADYVVVQEQARRDGDEVVLEAGRGPAGYVRPCGGDFREGQVLLEGGLRLNPWRLALAASAGWARVVCGGRPRVAILPNGDELVEPGRAVGAHQIYNAGAPALAAFVARQGGVPKAMRPARDDEADILSLIHSVTFDLLVTIGGASVGDHDRVKPALRSMGAELHLEGCAMRPGKPVWFALLPDGRPVLGLPGNPASALVCAELFLGPLLAALQGGTDEIGFETAVLAEPLPSNGPRDHYMRARIETGRDGARRVTPFPNQDSSLVSVMAQADVLVRRPPFAPAAPLGAVVEILRPGT
jgi:molybdopterin molybdotransferase